MIKPLYLRYKENWNKRHNLRAELLNNNIIDIAGFKMALETKSKTGVNHDLGFIELSKENRLYEEGESNFIIKNLQRGMTFVDVGANNGYYSLLAGKIGASKIYSIEPTPDTFKRLVKNIKLNKLQNKVISLNVALSDQKGTGYIHMNRYEDGQNSLLKGPNQKGRLKVTVNTLDNLFYHDAKKIDMIKIDVEGAECQVINGGIETILKNKNIIIIFEYSVDRKDNDKLFELLFQNGFHLYEIGETKIYRKEIKGENGIISRHLCNIVAVRNPKKVRF
jgi:FkbM family methyltransferase